MIHFLCLLFLSFVMLASGPAYAQEATRSPDQIVAQARLPVSFDGGVLGGPGAERLIGEADRAQFVIVIESHNDHVTPLVTADLFRQLNRAHGFDYLAIEQDPFGMEAASDASRRGRIDRIADHARRYPYSYTFATDEELQLLAMAGLISNARSQPIWGVDQVFGATALLEELLALSRSPHVRQLVQALLQDARAAEEKRNPEGIRDQQNHHFISSPNFDLPRRLAQLREEMAPEAGSRAEDLLNALQASAEIYSYYHRARELDEAGATLGLRNNWVREDWMKRRFMRHYREAQAAGDRQPKVVVKAGYWHAVRGRGPGNVFTLGNFLHEFAIGNSNEALSVQVLPLREWWPDHASVDPEYRVLLAPDAMDEASLVDLRPLRAHLHSGNSFGLEGAALRTFRNLVFGVDFALFMHSRPGAYTLTAQ